MAVVRFTKNLNRFFPELPETLEIDAARVSELIAELERRFPGLAHYVTDERGALRKHVNIFVDEQTVLDRERLSDPLQATSRVAILQALSGG